MVVWDYPCESKSSPAHYSKHPQPMVGGVFLLQVNQSEKNYLNIELQIIFGCLLDSMDIMRKFFIFGVPREN